MANLYTYEQFQKAAQDAGLLDQFSDADLALAQSNPDAGMSILGYKQDYANATTDEARALANEGAESIRSSYGNYTGGTDGSSFKMDTLSPSSFATEEAPTYESQYADQIQDLYEQQKNYGDFTYEAAPTYTNQYADQTQELLNAILNREDFSYDASTDPLYSQYRKQYAREGQRATQDALGSAAAASGGIPSTYAVTAASQAGDYYAAQMTDKIPELYAQAYQQYLNEYNTMVNNLGLVQEAEQLDYSKYLNQLSQYNTDRNFAYGTWQDAYNQILTNLQTGMTLEQQDYAKYLDQLSQYNTDRSFNYSQLLDEIDSQTLERQEALQKAELAAQMGDYSFLENMGIDTSDNPTDYERRYNEALLGANYGDYSGLASMGIDASNYELYQAALLAAQYGDYSGLQAMGIDTSNNDTDYERKYNEALLAASYGDYSKLAEMGIDASNNSEDWERQYQIALLKAQYGDYSGLQALGVNVAGSTASSGSSSSSKSGSSSSGTSSTGFTAASGSLSAGDKADLLALYPDGVIPAATWNSLVSTYGAGALTAAGFSCGDTVMSNILSKASRYT